MAVALAVAVAVAVDVALALALALALLKLQVRASEMGGLVITGVMVRTNVICVGTRVQGVYTYVYK